MDVPLRSSRSTAQIITLWTGELVFVSISCEASSSSNRGHLPAQTSFIRPIYLNFERFRVIVRYLKDWVSVSHVRSSLSFLPSCRSCRLEVRERTRPVLKPSHHSHILSRFHNLGSEKITYPLVSSPRDHFDPGSRVEGNPAALPRDDVAYLKVCECTWAVGARARARRAREGAAGTYATAVFHGEACFQMRGKGAKLIYNLVRGGGTEVVWDGSAVTYFCRRSRGQR